MNSDMFETSRNCKNVQICKNIFFFFLLVFQIVSQITIISAAMLFIEITDIINIKFLKVKILVYCFFCDGEGGGEPLINDE